MSTLQHESVIGVVGPRAKVERILSLDASSSRWRLIGAPHDDDSISFERLNRIRDSIDVILFTGKLQYDLALRSAELTVPATYCPMTGGSLASALLRGTAAGICDPARVSIDSFSADEVIESYAEFGVPTDDLRIATEYSGPESVNDLIGFHRSLYRDGRTSAAVTSYSSVARGLERGGVPTLRMQESLASLRAALNSAALQGARTRLEESRLATIVVELTMTDKSASGPANYWQQELKLSLHRILLDEVRRIGATVRDLDQSGFIVHATYGAIAAATDDYHIAPFMDRLEEELRAPVAMGVGLGRTARDAELHALTAIERSRSKQTGSVYMIDDDGALVGLPIRHRRGADRGRAESADAGTKGQLPADHRSGKAAELLAKLIDLLDGDPSRPLVVDASEVASTLGISARTARRTLHDLVAQGLAWPIPAPSTSTVGRPKRLYRLVSEKLSAETA